MIVTTDEVAVELGIQPVSVHNLVRRGRLTPLRPGAHPLRFRLTDVWAEQERRTTATTKARIDTLAERLLALSPTI